MRHLLMKDKIYYFLIGLYIWGMILTESQLSTIDSASLLLKYFRISFLGITVIYIIFSFKILNGSSKILYAFLVIIFALANFYISNGGTTILTITSVAIASKDKSLGKIFDVCLKNLLLSQLFVLLLCGVGILNDMLDIRGIDNFYVLRIGGSYLRHSFGFLNANQLPTTFLIMILIYMCIRKSMLRIWELVVMGIINHQLFLMCNSRISYILVYVTILLAFLIKIDAKKDKVFKRLMRLNFHIWYIPLLVVFSFWTALQHINTTSYTIWDYLLNFRPLYSYRALAYYNGISLLGYGDSAATRDVLESALNVDYNTVDNGYIFMLLQRGWLIGILIILAYCYILYIAKKRNNPYLFVAMLMLGLENIVNSHLTSYKVLPFLCTLINTNDVFLTVRSEAIRARSKILKLRNGKILFRNPF